MRKRLRRESGIADAAQIVGGQRFERLLPAAFACGWFLQGREVPEKAGAGAISIRRRLTVRGKSCYDTKTNNHTMFVDAQSEI